MTATQLLERLTTSMLAVGGGDAVRTTEAPEAGEQQQLMQAKLADEEEEEKHRDVLSMMGQVDEEGTSLISLAASGKLVALPVVMLEHVCSFLDHASLHAIEASSVAMYTIVKQSDLWMQLASHSVAVGDDQMCQHSWKQMLCLSSGLCRDNTKLIKGVKAYSSADRPSETPENTLKPSRCWRDINTYKRRESLNNLHEFYDVPTFVMTLGERIQMRCGCSSGNSCYWSSSASTDKNAADYIDYLLDGPCVVSSVQLLPYRVFWHPGSPTYGPQNIRIEFYERPQTNGSVAVDDSDLTGEMVASACEIVPFFQSPVFPVKNEMEMQEFQLPMRVWTSSSTVMRIRLLGRHQAQTFELPQWLQRTEEDRLPKYYCCLSFVDAVGLSRETLLSPKQVAPSRKRLKIAGAATNTTSGVPSSLSEIMAACFDTMMDPRRRVQLLGSPSG